MAKVGDKLPSGKLQEGDPQTHTEITDILKTGYLIGIPAAFSPNCTQGHIPKYITQKREKDPGDIVVVAVNDGWVMGAWQDHLEQGQKSGVRFLGDPSGEYIDSLIPLFDATPLLGQKRSNRFAMVIKNGVIEKIEVEPDPTQVTITSADRIL